MAFTSAHSRRRFHFGDLNRSLLRPGCGLPAPAPASIIEFDDDDDRCIKQSIQALAENPHDAGAYFQRGLAYRNKGFFAVALSDLRHAVRCEPGFAAAYHELALIQLGRAEPRVRDLSAALVNAQHAYRLTGGQHWPYVRTLVGAHRDLGQHGEATRLLLKAEPLVPDKDVRWWTQHLWEGGERLFAGFVELDAAADDASPLEAAATEMLQPEWLTKAQRDLISADFARRFRVVPLAGAGEVARFAAANADDFDLIALLQFVLGRPVELIAVPPRLLDATLERCYRELKSP